MMLNQITQYMYEFEYNNTKDELQKQKEQKQGKDLQENFKKVSPNENKPNNTP